MKSTTLCDVTTLSNVVFSAGVNAQRMEEASLFRAELDLTLKTTESEMVRARGKQRDRGRGGARDAAILDGIIIVGADSTSNDWEPIVDMPFSLAGCRRRRLRTD